MEECEHFYFQGTLNTATNTGVGDNDKYYCTDKCKIENVIDLYYITGKKNCATDCSTFSKHYFNPNNNECLDTCKGLPGLEFANQIVAPNTQEKCRSDCTSGSNTYQYHDYGSFICTYNCGYNDKNKLYTKHATDGSQYVCYSSCAEIPGGAHIYEKGNVCYDSLPQNDADCAYFYIKANGGKQCASKVECVNKNYKYFIEDRSRQGYECRENCDGYYKMEVTESMDINNDNTNENIKINKCYDSKEKALSDTNVKYYNIKSKLCWNEYPTGYYILPTTSTTQFEVVEECEYFYYKNSVPNPGTDPATSHNEYHCVDKCTDSSLKYFIKGQKNCENSCTDFKKHFYNPNNNECLDTCKGLPNLEFVNQITSSSPSNPCKKQCDDPDDNSDVNVYYDFDSNICITKCGENNPKYIYHTTSGKMCYPSCTDIPGGSYVYESSETETDGSKICYDSKPTGNTCNYYYMKKDGTLECLGDTPNKCKEINYNYLLGEECKLSLIHI